MEKNVIVIKVGSSILASHEGELNVDRLKSISAEIAAIKEVGYSPILVSSGAVAAGSIITVASSLPEHESKRVKASVGQPLLIHSYIDAFSEAGVRVGQVLLSQADFADREHYEALRSGLLGMLESNLVPIVNENDAVVIHKKKFGGNDTLAANIAIALCATKLLILTDQEGLMTADPRNDKNAELIPLVNNVEKSFFEASSKSGSALGTGGMYSKVKAAALATSAGVPTWIASGMRENVITAINDDEQIGTHFIAQSSDLSDRDRWFLSGRKAQATIVVDDGAAKALRDRKSLLVVGIKRVLGEFSKRDIVEITTQNNEAIGYGITHYASSTLDRALGGNDTLDHEVIHTDNIKLL